MPVNNLIQFRRGSDWSVNPVLATGEPAFDYSSNILKVGDGTQWSGILPIGSISGALATVYSDLNLNQYNITGVGGINIDGDVSAGSGNFTALSINAGNGGFVFPTGDGTLGQVLKTDGNGSVVWGTDLNTGGGSTLAIYSTGVQVGDSDIETLDFSDNFTIVESPDQKINISLTGVLENVVEDTTPQLGGNLDLQTYDITSDGTTGGDLKIGINPIGSFFPIDYHTLITDNANTRVGIGIDSPSYPLDIGTNGSTTDSSMRVQKIVPLNTVVIGTAHSTSSITPQGGHYGSVLFGNGASPTTSKCFSYATNYFSAAGDAQKVSTVVQYETTDATTKYLNAAKTGGYLYSTYVRNDTFILPIDGSATFTIHLIANNDTDGTSAGWIFRGCVKSVSRSLSFVGSPITENFTDSGMSSATAVIEVQDGSGISAYRKGGLVIKVNGLTSKTIRWVATIDAVLTSF